MSVPYAEVIGDPIAQSKSPAIHGFWLAKLGIEAEYRATRVTPDDIGDFLAERREDPDWRGCNVTMPLKQMVQPNLHSIEEPAASIGAVNTICPVSDRLLAGYNTDAPGFLEPLRDRLGETHYFRMARILGTGGAARAIVSALAAEGFVIVLAGRDPAKARALLDELAPEGEHHAVDLAHFADPTDFAFDDREGCCDLIVNASPLGMRGQPPLAFDWSHAPPGAIAYDIVTDPMDTPFLQGAREAGFATIDGLSMLIGQAAFAFERFFGAKPPREHDAELRALLVR
ncbi:shikimate dehydrogenase [Erythrobacter sp. 3-20A1M]|uniref:shikimate dehydrogenase family protein n=1 Tax=Erythrobacter sp. 3-20A1M TaxID=2653850 RepID=UPI001BFC39F8|nr:shikimate dehydrogenase [Erythrobacter sp. 3-20A1M]QWC56795.1 shikimate dehydrogenase [Erythrobacter sp. 3-20A1M]